MSSPTKRTLASIDVAAVTAEALGTEVDPNDCEELSGAGFASVWRIRLADGTRVVLKTAPAERARLLRYEHGLLAEEARYYRLVAERADNVPVPAVLFFGGSPQLGGAPVLLASHLPGRPLSEIGNAAPRDAVDGVREQLGATVARIHEVTGTRFGYSGDRPHAATWEDAFAAIIESLLLDARDWQVELPLSPSELRAVVDRNRSSLREVSEPALVHFDLWDGNVLVEPGRDRGWSLTGLVDGERCLYGDPLIDFVSPLLYRRIEDEPLHPFLRGYRSASATALELSSAAVTRLRLYRAHLYLVMLVEMPSRGMIDPERHELLWRLLIGETAEL